MFFQLKFGKKENIVTWQQQWQRKAKCRTFSLIFKRLEASRELLASIGTKCFKDKQTNKQNPETENNTSFLLKQIGDYGEGKEQRNSELMEHQKLRNEMRWVLSIIEFVYLFEYI